MFNSIVFFFTISYYLLMNRILFIVSIIPIIKIDEIVFNKPLLHRL
nr:MAG TPA: hypothetical protein [Caudoviricetes sp.]